MKNIILFLFLSLALFANTPTQEVLVQEVVKAEVKPFVKVSDVPQRAVKTLVELKKIKEATKKVEYANMVISPLFYAKMRYYDSLTFRMFENNALLATGGIYTIDGVEAAGFALYTDECISSKMSKEEDK